MAKDEEGNELYEDLERRALFDLPEEDDEPGPDLLETLRDTVPVAAVSKDVTLGGYIDEHNRVPAFEGSDGQPYTVDIDIDDSDDIDAPFVAFLVFIRWAETGAGIMDHVESGDVGTGRTADEARRAALDLSLYEVKAELDAAIDRRRRASED